MSDARTHELKTWPSYFVGLLSGEKTFEVRKNDRGFELGDSLRLREFDPAKEVYTGREVVRRVTYILHGPGFGITEGFVVMALKATERGE